MAAEYVFYGQNTTGVGGDLGQTTRLASLMVGVHGMAPAPIDLSDRIEDPEAREEAERRAKERFERLGFQLMHRSGAGALADDAFASALSDPDKRRLIAGLLGQAFVVAWNTIRLNRDGAEHVAERLIAAGELYGDDVTDLLDGAVLRKPAIDVTDETTWPAI